MFNQPMGRPGDYLESDKIDHLILYEAENNLPQFLQDYEQGTAKKVYDNKDKPAWTLPRRRALT